MRKPVLTLAAGLSALALSIGAAAPATAGSVYTGGKSCHSSSYAYTRGTSGVGSTVQHWQYVGTTWYGSTPAYNGGPGSLNTTFIVGTWVKSFGNAYVNASPDPWNVGAHCA